MLSFVLGMIAIGLFLVVGFGAIISFIIMLIKDDEYVGALFITFLLVVAILSISSLVLSNFGM